MNASDFDSVNAHLSKISEDKGIKLMGLSGILQEGNGDSYYTVSIDRQSVNKIKSYGSISETLVDMGDRYSFRLYLDEIEEFMR